MTKPPAASSSPDQVELLQGTLESQWQRLAAAIARVMGTAS